MSTLVIDPPTKCPPFDNSQRILAIGGEHDISTIEGLSLLFADAIGDGADPLVVDLSAVSFMDASVVGMLVRTRARMAEDGKTLIVQAPSRRARRVLDMCDEINPTGLVVRDCAACRP